MLHLLIAVAMGVTDTRPHYDESSSSVPFSGAGGVTLTGAATCGTAADGAIFDNNGGAIGCPKLTDVAPQGMMFRAQPAFPGGTQTAAKVVLCGGQDETTITIDDYTLCEDDTVTITVIDSNGTSTATVLTESELGGSDWNAVTSNNQTATNLAAQLNDGTPDGVTATASSAVVRIVIDPDTCFVLLAESDATCTTVSVGTAGSIVARSGAAATPAYTFAEDADTGLYRSAANTVAVAVGGGVWGSFSGNGVMTTGASSECSLSRGLLVCTSQSAVVRLHQQQNTLAAEVMSSADATTEVGARLGTAVTDGSLTGAATLRLAQYCTDCDGTPVEKGYVNANGDTIMDGMYAQDSVSTITVNGATTFAMTKNMHKVDCDGAEIITTITGGSPGALLTIIMVDAECAFTDTDDGGADTLDLDETDAVADDDIDSADDKTLQLGYDGTLWRQVGKVSTN